MRPRFSTLPRAKAAVAIAASLAAGSVVQASIRHHPRPRSSDPPRARFAVSGRVLAPLSPGATQPVEVTLINRIRHELWISDLKLTVSVDVAHARAGCSAARDYVVTQLPASVYPILLPGRSPYTASWPARIRWPAARHARLSDLGVPFAPTIFMPNLPDVDQDGCKGARLALRFWATSRLHPRYVGVPAAAPPGR